jgi:hypothetical protein
VETEAEENKPREFANPASHVLRPHFARMSLTDVQATNMHREIRLEVLIAKTSLRGKTSSHWLKSGA